MNTYIQALSAQLSGQRPGTEVLLEKLFDIYAEKRPMNVSKIAEDFSALSHTLSQLSMQDHDRVWDLTCKLCWEHQRDGFLEGVKTGIRLSTELAE